jgi:hypothetical protein
MQRRGVNVLAFFKTPSGQIDWSFALNYLQRLVTSDGEHTVVVIGVIALPVFVYFQANSSFLEVSAAILVSVAVYAGYVLWEAYAGIERYLYPLEQGDLVYARMSQIATGQGLTLATFELPGGHGGHSIEAKLTSPPAQNEGRAVALHDRASGHVLLPTLPWLDLVRDPARQERLREEAARSLNASFRRPGLHPDPG